MFIYSLPIFFSYIKLVSPAEALIIFWAVFAVIFLGAPAGPGYSRRDFRNRYLISAWLGDAPLGWVFWPFFLLLNGGLYGIDILAKSGTITVSSWDEAHLILLFPVFWWTTGVWRCSPNTGSRLWAACARMMTLSVFLEYVLKVLIRIEYPRIFFNCEEILLDYGSCF